MEIHSARLKKQIQKDPERGMEQVMELYSGQVRTICRNILAGYPKEDIEEAVAQSFIALWQGIERYSPAGGCSLKSYLYGIARKTALMKRRSCPLRENISLEEWNGTAAETAEEIFFTAEEERRLHEAVAEMDEPARTVFLMRYFYFEKIGDISERLGLPYKKVENILQREKKTLRRLLEEKGIER